MMFRFFKKIPLYFCLFALMQCKKVDKNEAVLNSTPSIVTSNSTLFGTGQGAGEKDLYSYIFKTHFLIGDTVEMVGRLFPENVQIRIGNTLAKVILKKRVNIQGTPDVPTVECDFLKFLITADMGIGRGIPVVITANGQTITAPSFSILKIGDFTGTTDPTLIVDSLFSFLQPNLNPYELVMLGGNVNAKGQICFYNRQAAYIVPLQGVQPIKLMGIGVQYGEPGDLFEFYFIKAAAYSWDGTEVYISGYVTDNGPNNPAVGVEEGAKPWGVIRLIKMNLLTKKITVLNRSFFGGFVSRGHYYDFPPDKPVTGNLAQVYVGAVEIRVDANGSLYIQNQIPLPSNNSSTFVSKITNGQVKTLFSQDAKYPGVYMANGEGYQFNSGSLLGYAGLYYRPSGSNYSYYSFKTEEPLLYKDQVGPFTFSYSDTSKVTGYASKKKSNLYDNGMASFTTKECAVLNTGEVVMFSGAITAIAWNIEKNGVYTYAGCETNTVSQYQSGDDPYQGDYTHGLQQKRSGLAKYVDFRRVMVLGVDEKNAIYLYRMPRALPDPAVPESYVKFYKLYKP